MSNTNETQAPRFVVGKTCNVWKPTGVRNLKGGPSTSEKTGGDYRDILPSEALTVLKVFGSRKALVQRQDGQEVFIHLNHIDSGQSYNTQKKRAPAAPQGSIKSQLERKRKELEAAQAQYEDLLEKAETSMSQDLPMVASR